MYARVTPGDFRITLRTGMALNFEALNENGMQLTPLISLFFV